MIRKLRRWVHSLLPEWLVLLLTRHRRIRYTGPYATWEAARRRSKGYESPKILERVIAGTRAVTAGQASFERDSVAFAEPAPDPVILAALSRSASAHRNRPMRVLDFGGALGGCYHQHRPFFAGAVQWMIVEQSHYVAIGQTEFETTELHFHATIESACATGNPDLVLLSSVLQYVQDPEKTLATLAALPTCGWLISRTPFCQEPDDLIVVQHVPRHIYPASYPAWVFSESRFSNFWELRGKKIGWHASPEGVVPLGRVSLTYRTAEIHSI
jgi:putative methyltransferase (TIGR04325 family)